jgi:hypothetical protein
MLVELRDEISLCRVGTSFIGGGVGGVGGGFGVMSVVSSGD